jgi:hypothetical protein
MAYINRWGNNGNKNPLNMVRKEIKIRQHIQLKGGLVLTSEFQGKKEYI